MTGRELIKWLLDADELLAADVLDMPLAFSVTDPDNQLNIDNVDGASVQGNEVHLY